MRLLRCWIRNCWRGEAQPNPSTSRARRDGFAKMLYPSYGHLQLSHHTRNESRLSARWLNVVLEEAARALAGIARPGEAPGAAFVVALTGVAADVAAFGLVVVLDLERAIVTAVAIGGSLDRTDPGFDDAGAADARDAAIALDPRRHLVLQPAHRVLGIVARVIETPGAAFLVALADQRAFGRIARHRHRPLIIAARPVETGLGLDRCQVGQRQNGECCQTDAVQAAPRHTGGLPAVVTAAGGVIGTPATCTSDERIDRIRTSASQTLELEAVFRVGRRHIAAPVGIELGQHLLRRRDAVIDDAIERREMARLVMALGIEPGAAAQPAMR